MASSEKASDVIQRLRRKLVTVLCGDPDLVLVQLDSLLLITPEECVRLNEISNPDRRVRALLNSIVQKGEASCLAFLGSLKNLQGVFPDLNDLTEDGSLPGWKVPVSPEASEGTEDNGACPQTGMKEKDADPCTDCEKSFPHARNGVSHYRIHTGERSYSCTQCGKSFIRKGNFLNHQRIHTGDPPFSGKKHEKSKNDKEKLLKHQITETQTFPFSCTECGKNFNKNVHLKRHQGIHTKGRSLFCSESKKSFNWTEHLQRDQKIHTGKCLKTLTQRRFPCTLCKKSFIVKKCLLNHQRKHTQEVQFSCTVCKKSFNQKFLLKRHQPVHTEERPFVCSQCEKSFNRIHPHQKHQRIHTRERPFFCSQCKESFDRREHLKRHQIIHTKERPFACCQCKKRFNRQEHLKRHQTIHTGEKPFFCSQCKIKFTRQEHLQRHQRIHNKGHLKTLTKIRFSCIQCDKSFHLEADLLRHQVAHTRPYSCTACERSFSQKSKLKRHQKIHTCHHQFGAQITDKGTGCTGSLHRNPVPAAQKVTDEEKEEDHARLESERCINWEKSEKERSTWGSIYAQTQAESDINQHKEILEAPTVSSRKVILKAATFTFKSSATVTPPMLVAEMKRYA